MEVKVLTSTDRARIEEVETQIADAAQQVGFCREQYLQREEALLSRLAELRQERTGMLHRLAKDYIGPDSSLNDWRYNADTKTFEKIP